MDDYLQPAGKGWRVVCFIASAVSSAAFLFGAAVLWRGMFREGQFTFEGKPLWIGAIFITAVGVAAAFIAFRLAHRDASGSVTTLPVWFIQSFGVFFLLGGWVVGYEKKDLVFALESTSVGIAMVLVGQSIARRKRKRPNQSLEPTPGSVTPRAK